MRWTNFVTLGEVLWLSCLGSGHASALSKESVRRQTPPPPGGFVYRGDSRSPQEIRGTGGFRPQGDGWENHDSSFDLTRHYTAGQNGCGLDDFDEPDFVFRTAYVSAAQKRRTAENYGQWLYEIRATPNILDNDHAESEVMALGGFHWRQVRRYTRMRDAGDNRVDESRWIDNPEYDAQLYERGEHAHLCRVSTSFPVVLAGESDSGHSDSGSTDSGNSDSEDGSREAGAERRLFNAAYRWMDQTDGIYELYGPFPPTWTEYAPRDDIPGPDHPAPPEAEDAQVGALLQHYIDMGAQELDRLFPNGNQFLQELFRDIQPIGCPSISGIGSHLGRSDRRATASIHGCCKILSSFRKKTKAKALGAKTTVDICQNGPLSPPCTTVKAPSGRCVAVPQEYNNTVSGVKGHGTTSICRFYLEPDCKGGYFEAGTQVVDLYTARPKFNDKVASLVCDTAKPKAAPERWEWTSKNQEQLCTRLDKVSLDFELANNIGSGTNDKIKLAIDDAGQKVHVITEGPSPGYKVSQDFNLRDMFGMDTVALSQIKRLRLLDELTDRTFGGDAWELHGLKLKGRCAGSGINITMEKFSNLNKGLQAQPTEPGRLQYNRDWEVWADDVKPQDWVAKPLCSHFRRMSVNLHVADADWAGTNNNLYAKVGEGSFLIARHPSRKEIFTTDIDVDKAYKTKHVPVTNVASVGIASEGGHDAALPEMVTVYGICSTTSTVLSVKQEITDWLYDGQTMTIALPPENWVKA